MRACMYACMFLMVVWYLMYDMLCYVCYVMCDCYATYERHVALCYGLLKFCMYVCVHVMCVCMHLCYVCMYVRFVLLCLCDMYVCMDLCR